MALASTENIRHDSVRGLISVRDGKVAAGDSFLVQCFRVIIPTMPKKIRELKRMLQKAGFAWRPGKGSHTVWSHPLVPKPVVLSGKDGRDARRYQEERVEEAIKTAEENS